MSRSVPATDRRRRGRRTAVALGLAGAMLLLVGWPLASPIAHASQEALRLEYGRNLPSAGTLVNFTINTTDAPAYDPPVLSGAAAGDPVSVHVINLGSYAHGFTVVPQLNYQLPSGLTPAALDAWFAANGSLANLTVAPGASGYANFTLPVNSTGGAFEFLSLVPYQFQAGMVGSLAVAAGGPSVILDEKSTGNLQFVPNVLVANATTYPLVLEVVDTNVGSLFHTWTLSPLAGVYLTPANFTSYFQAHPPAENLQIPPTDGAVVNGSFVIDGPGVYEYICTAPGHFANGMNGTLWVGVQPPAAAPPLSTALVQQGVLIGAGALVLLGTVVAAVSNYLGRFPSRGAPAH